MSEKKVASRNLAIVLGIIAIILLVGLVGAMANYTSIINGKDNTITTKDSQIQTLTSQKNQLQTWLDGNKTLLNQTQRWLQANITYYNSQITDLENQTDTLKAPKLISVYLHANDVRKVYPWDPNDNLHVYGYICNVGTNRAYNCKLHVVAYQSGGVVAIDTYITLHCWLGVLSGESWASVDANIYYSGSALVSRTTTPEWTDSP